MFCKKKKWEYTVVTNPTLEELNEMGAEGWELVSVMWHEGLGRKYNPVTYLKRAL